MIRPFLSGFAQVLLVAGSTVFLSARFAPGVLVTGFMISLLWTINVRNALAGWPARLAYCVGASLGSLSGMYLSEMILKYN